MYLCYIDESGTPDIPGNTSHYVLAGVSIPVVAWKNCDKDVEKIKAKYSLQNQEIHVAWILRSYPEQNKIPNFESFPYNVRRQKVASWRVTELLRLQRLNKPALLSQTKKNFKQTEKYVHLTLGERKKLIWEIACKVSGWRFARLFAECVDKPFYVTRNIAKSVDEQSFEQVISRFEQCLRVPCAWGGVSNDNYGMLIHDNNPTVAKKHTLLMKRFHEAGTLWTKLNYIIETPLFVDSALTGMVQIADLCAYALRRYLENGEEPLFKLIFARADRNGSTVVGVRHYTDKSCKCRICVNHRKSLGDEQ